MAKPSILGRLAAAGRILAGFDPLVNSFPQGGPRGARYGRRSQLFEQERRQINAAILSGGAALRARSRWLCRENPWAANMKRVWTSYAVGGGWTPSVQEQTPDVQKSLHQWWKAWGLEADVAGLTDINGLQAMVADEEFEAGEVFVRLVASEAGLRLQMLSSEQLPYWNTASDARVDPGNVLRLGVEFDPQGRRVAYHFYKRNPGDVSYMDASISITERVPADQILHIFTPAQPGQVRGLPRLTGAIVALFKLDEYQDALAERAAQSAKVVGFLQKKGDDTDERSDQPDNGDGSRNMSFETGMVYALDANEEWKQSEPPDPGTNYDDFTRWSLQGITASAGLPYTEVTGDLFNANFSSARIGRMPFRRFVERWGEQVLCFQFLRPVWREGLRWAILTGSVRLARGASRDQGKYLNVDWIGPYWEYIDPYKDVQTDALAVDHGFKSRSRVIRERGAVAEEVDAEIRADRDREEQLDLQFATAIPANPEQETTPAPQDAAKPKRKNARR